jgi:hypothetical protein
MDTSNFNLIESISSKNSNFDYNINSDESFEKYIIF